MSTLQVDNILNSAGTGGPNFPDGFTSTGSFNAVTGSNSISNLGLAVSVASNAMTINVTQQDGVSSPGTFTNAVQVAFRSTSLNSGQYFTGSITAPLSLVVPSGATLGTTSGVQATLYVYLTYNSGVVALAISFTQFLENTLLTTTTISAGSTSGSTAYSTVGASNLPFRLVGELIVTETTAGLWATAPSAIQLAPFPTTATLSSQANNTVLGNISGSAAIPIAVTLSSLAANFPASSIDGSSLVNASVTGTQIAVNAIGGGNIINGVVSPIKRSTAAAGSNSTSSSTGITTSDSIPVTINGSSRPVLVVVGPGGDLMDTDSSNTLAVYKNGSLLATVLGNDRSPGSFNFYAWTFLDISGGSGSTTYALRTNTGTMGPDTGSTTALFLQVVEQ